MEAEVTALNVMATTQVNPVLCLAIFFYLAIMALVWQAALIWRSS
jgi:hypothetical protein